MYAPQMINNLIGERAMAYEAKRLGFEATEADTAEAVRHSLPPQLFKDGKLVSKDLYAQVLARTGHDHRAVRGRSGPAGAHQPVARLRSRPAWWFLRSKSSRSTAKRNEKAKIDYVMMPTAKYTAEAQASDAELKAYFDKHRADYQVPEKKSLAVLVIDPATIQNEIQPTDAELQALYRVIGRQVPGAGAREGPPHSSQVRCHQ